LLIRTEADLLALMRPPSPLHPFRRPPVLLDIPQLAAEENAVWGHRLEQIRRQCGCTAAIAGLGIFTAAGVAFVLIAALQPNSGGEPDYPAILLNGGLFLAGLIGSALLGKLAGLSLAALRFRRTCRALRQRLRTACGN
jgi:hypothetical protein